MKIVKVCELGVQPVNASGCLFHHLVGVVLGVKYNGVGRNTVPPLGSGIVLNQVDPVIALRNWLVLVPVPFRNFGFFAIVETFQDLQFVVEVIEYNGFWMVLDDLQQGNLPGFV